MAKHTKRNLAIMSLAVLCLFLVTTAQPTQAILPIVIYGLILGISLIAEYLYLNYWFSQQAPEEGATLETYLNLYYTKVLDSLNAINGELANMVEVFPTTKYLFARKAEFTSMTFVNESVFPSFKVLNGSGVLPQMANITFAYLRGLNAVFNGLSNETAHYFINEFGDLEVTDSANTSISGLNARYLYWIDNNFPYQDWENGLNDESQGVNNTFQCFSNGSLFFIDIKYNWTGGNHAGAGGSATWNLTFTTLNGLNNPITENTTITQIYTMAKDGIEQQILYELPEGWWNVSLTGSQDYFADPYNSNHVQGADLGIWTDAYIFDLTSETVIRDPEVGNTAPPYSILGPILTTNDLYIIFNGANEYQNPTETLLFRSEGVTINTITVDRSNFPLYVDALNDVVYTANMNAAIYHTTLRNLGYDEYSEIPPEYILAWVDGTLLLNTQGNLTYVEMLNLYYAYLQGLANLFNSTNYQTANWSVPLANWTWANILVNGTLYNSTNANITEGWLYFSMPNEEVTFTVGENTTFTDPGWCFNTNNSRLYQYQAGYYVAVNNLTVNGIYGINGTITPYTIDFIVNPPEEPDEPQATGTGGGGGSSLGLILLIIVAALILLSRGKNSSDNPVNIIMPKSRATNTSDHRPVHKCQFNFIDP